MDATNSEFHIFYFNSMKIIECPRDAMQGLDSFIVTDKKIRYINQLLRVGFDTIDFGSFVNPKAIPQMRDTAEVLQGLEVADSNSALLAIVANLRGAKQAAAFEEIVYLGFPLSLSETFQQRNTNRTIAEALVTVAEIQQLCSKHDKQLVTYLSMGFGNPYKEPYNPEVVVEFVRRLSNFGVPVISLADTIGVSHPENIAYLFDALIPEFPHIEFGAHFHSHPSSAKEKIEAAYLSGCRRIDAALKGYGGCPMAEDKLVGNIATEVLIDCLDAFGAPLSYDKEALDNALSMAHTVFD